jgi:hypothetical protein
VLLAAAVLVTPLSLATAQAPAGVCSLSWPQVTRAFRPGNGWHVLSPPVPLWLSGDGAPDYQAQFFEATEGDQAAVVVAEWGDPESPELGPVVYCAIRDGHGQAVEEVGAPPWDREPDEPEADQPAPVES